MLKLDLDPEPRVLRQFAWISLLGFPLLALMLAWQAGLPLWPYGAAIALVGALVFLVEIVVVPRLGGQSARVLELLVPKTVYRTLSLVALPIGFVVSHLLLAAIYYLVVTPIGLLLRATGRDAMRGRRDPQARTYWLERKTERAASTYFELY